MDNDTVVLIDGPNLFASAKLLDITLDFEYLRDWLDERYSIPTIQYYTAVYTDDKGQTGIQSLVDWLSYNGYRLITKPARKIDDKIKGNMDIELALDAVQFADNGIKRVVMFTGDGDFVPLIAYLQKRNIWVTVISTTHKRPPMCADILRKQADHFIELNDIREVIQKGEING